MPMRDLEVKLLNASLDGAFTVVAKALAGGANVDLTTTDGTTPLLLAAENGHVGIVEALLTAGATVDLTPRGGPTALLMAAGSGHLAIVDALLAAGAQVDLAKANGETPLFLAADRGHTTVVGRLLKGGASPDLAVSTGTTPVCIAAYKGHTTIVEMLLDAGAATMDAEGDSALHYAAWGRHQDVIRVLLDAGVDTSIRNKQGLTAADIVDATGNPAAAQWLRGHTPTPATLFRAVQRGDLDGVQRLAKLMGAVDSRGFTALHCAMRARHKVPRSGYAATSENDRFLILCSILSANSVNVDAQNHTGETALHIGSEQGDTHAVRLLLDHGARTDLVNNEGASPLFVAVEHGFGSIVEILLASRAHVDAENINGFTPLVTAALYGHAAVVEKLLAAGANVDHAVDDGATALYLAAQEGYDAVVKVLITGGANVDFARQSGATPLYTAAQKGHTAIVALLVGAGADVNLALQDGTTPLAIGAQKGHVAIVELLLAAGSSVDTMNANSYSALLCAAACGHEQVARVLVVDGGADGTLLNNRGMNAAELFERSGNHQGAVALSREEPSLTAFFRAIRRNDIAMLRRIATTDFVNAVHESGVTALQYALQSRDDHRQRQAVRRSEQQPNTVCASSTDDDRLAVLRLLLTVDGANIDAQNDKGESALLSASQLGETHAVQLLLRHGARTDITNWERQTPLSVAATPEIKSILQLYHKSQQYHDQCFEFINNRDASPSPAQITALVPLITSVYDLRWMFTLVSLSSVRSCHAAVLKSALSHVVDNKLTFHDDACAFFKLVLDRCKQDNLISTRDIFLFDRKAEKANTESADWVVEMKKQVCANSWRLDTHEQYLRSVVDGVRHVHAMVVQNRAAIVATARRTEQLQAQVADANQLLGQLIMHAKQTSAQMNGLQTRLTMHVKHTASQVDLFQQRLAQTDRNIKHVATHLVNFRDAYTNRIEHEEKVKRIKRVCGIVASVAGFVIGPVLNQISDAVVDFVNPIEIVSTIYGEEDIAAFLAEQSDKVLSDVVKSQLEKYAIPQDEFETLLREDIALLHPEIVTECESRGLALGVVGGSADFAEVTPTLEAEETVVLELLHDLHAALRDISSERGGADITERHTAIDGFTDLRDRQPSSFENALSSATVVPHTDHAKQSFRTNETGVTVPPTHTAKDAGGEVHATTGVTVNSSSSPFHAAIEQSRGDLATFKTLVSTISTDDMDASTPADVQLRTTHISRETLCAAEYAYAIGHSAVGNYLASRMQRPPRLDMPKAVAVVPTQPVDAFAYVCVVDGSHGDVDVCAELCDLMEKGDHALEATFQADVEREVLEISTRTAVEYACHLGYVEIVRYMLKELCKKMEPNEKIKTLKLARERAAVGAAA